MAKKILILLGDAGGGHMSAAKALAAGFAQADPDSQVIIRNLSETEKGFPFNATDSTWKLVSRYPALEFISDAAYAVTNSDDGVYVAKKLAVSAGKKAVIKAIREYQPDVVISAYFIVSAILEDVKAKFPGIVTVGIVCDLVGFPRMLADRNADIIFCPTPEAAKRMQSFGVAAEHIRFPYFPVKPELGQAQPREKFLRSLNMNPNLKTILVTGGGVGTVSMLDTISRLIKSETYQVIVICGHSKSSYSLLNKKFRKNPSLHLEHFVDNMPDFMAASDLIVAKPGPATIVEIEALGKLAIFTHIIGKQEYGNIEFLKQNPNFVYLPGTDDNDIVSLIEDMLSRPPVKFPPRFPVDSSLQMATIINQL